MKKSLIFISILNLTTLVIYGRAFVENIPVKDSTPIILKNQFLLTVEAGAGISKYYNSEIDNYMYTWGGTAGIHAAWIRLLPKRFYWSYHTGLLFQQKGNGLSHNTNTHLHNSYLTIPFVIRGNYRSGFFSLGLYSSILLDYTKNDDFYEDGGLSPTDFGMMLGFGFHLSPYFNIKANYDMGLAKILSYKIFHSGGSAFKEFHFTNRSFFFTLEYNFVGVKSKR
ncbi:MAG: outer membrane beta-barrel protein [Saprospiraceae bacterium]|nr:outer membrane beta-barrel protein [Saprospiraceae bacterium]